MKKFIFFMILLLIVAGTVFYFGWIRIPENTVGLIYSDIAGYDKEFMKPGKINWRWQKLIPKNYSIKIYANDTLKSDITVSGELPSGNVYASVLDGNPDFSYETHISISYRIIEDYLYNLAVNGQLHDNGTYSLTASAEEKLNSICSQVMKGEAEAAVNENRKAASGKELADKIRKEIEAGSEMFKIISIETTYTDFPDTELYNEGKKQYLEMLSTRKELALTQEKDNAAYSTEIEKRIETLKKYGALLTEYPILIEYLKTKDEKLLPEGVDFNF